MAQYSDSSDVEAGDDSVKDRQAAPAPANRGKKARKKTRNVQQSTRKKSTGGKQGNSKKMKLPKRKKA